MTPLSCAKDRFQFHLLQMLELSMVVFIYEYSCLPTLTQSIYESKAWARWNDPAFQAQPREIFAGPVTWHTKASRVLLYVVHSRFFIPGRSLSCSKGQLLLPDEGLTPAKKTENSISVLEIGEIRVRPPGGARKVKVKKIRFFH